MLEALLFASGDTVPVSGIYRVSHAGHGQGHYATCLSGKTFPLCKTCGNRVRFAPFQLADDVDHDARFF
jgi:hypothetical protein